jgi:predicted transcriptional regulator
MKTRERVYISKSRRLVFAALASGPRSLEEMARMAGCRAMWLHHVLVIMQDAGWVWPARENGWRLTVNGIDLINSQFPELVEVDRIYGEQSEEPAATPGE